MIQILNLFIRNAAYELVINIIMVNIKGMAAAIKAPNPSGLFPFFQQ